MVKTVNNKNDNGDARPLIRGIYMGVVTFLLSILLTQLSNAALGGTGLILSVPVLLVIIFIGILFDIIGVAVTAAGEASFHAMAAKKVYGAVQSIRLVRHADRVSSICNDLVGDVCGTVSGAAAASIVFQLVARGTFREAGYASLLLVGMAAALTVGGKAAGKYLALHRCREIVFRVGQVLAWAEAFLGVVVLAEKGKMRRRR